MILGAGKRDARSIKNVIVNGQAGVKAGMHVVKIVVPDTGHDWHSVNADIGGGSPLAVRAPAGVWAKRA